ncbi:MAG: S9 family peptidase [Deltaproteobacteria bacterium]|nr:S9 family peptidase [Deltaproteobacteria bacterium]MBI3017676.1 S9 family peptidase [Deltaproteobacteria bacterium]
MPTDASLDRQFQGNLLITLKSDWVFEGTTFKQGALLYVNLDEFVQGGSIHVEVVFEPTATMTVNGVSRSKDHIFVSVLDNVRGRLIQMHRGAKGWIQHDVPLPPMGTISVMSSSKDHHQIFVNYEDFLTPDTLYLYNARTKKLRLAKSLPPRFDPEKYVTEQFFATSRDGTKVPYFIVRAKEMEFNGKNPTYLYGYGGFEVSEVPYYADRIERLWLSQGGVFVQANIRGGGEFGPAWHQAAMKENRQKAFDDFIAVAEDLMTRGITSPKHLGIRGGSNGGLLVGAVAVQRPDLFGAVMCNVPLLDMMRYHTLLAGASWMAEYGDPDDPKMRPSLFAYSPYHNVKPGVTYPEIFFETSTKDDRVHPAHARKMAFYMGEQGHPFLYFEDIDGGHGGGITPEHAAEATARFYTYFLQKLKD